MSRRLLLLLTTVAACAAAPYPVGELTFDLGPRDAEVADGLIERFEGAPRSEQTCRSWKAAANEAIERRPSQALAGWARAKVEAVCEEWRRAEAERARAEQLAEQRALEQARDEQLAEQRAQRAAMSDEDVRDAIIERQSSEWDGPCRCPDDAMSNGRRCGGNSAYSRQGGAGPACYPGDVTQEMVEAYRAGAGSVDR